MAISQWKPAWTNDCLLKRRLFTNKAFVFFFRILETRDASGEVLIYEFTTIFLKNTRKKNE